MTCHRVNRAGAAALLLITMALCVAPARAGEELSHRAPSFLRLRVQPARATIHVMEPLILQAELSNTGEIPVELESPVPGDLAVRYRRADSSDEPRWWRDPGKKSWNVPRTSLAPGEKLTFEAWVLDDAMSKRLVFEEPGEYEIEACFGIQGRASSMVGWLGWAVDTLVVRVEAPAAADRGMVSAHRDDVRHLKMLRGVPLEGIESEQQLWLSHVAARPGSRLEPYVRYSVARVAEHALRSEHDLETRDGLQHAREDVEAVAQLYREVCQPNPSTPLAHRAAARLLKMPIEADEAREVRRLLEAHSSTRVRQHVLSLR